MRELKNFVVSIDVENNKSGICRMSSPQFGILDEIILGLFDETFSSRD